MPEDAFPGEEGDKKSKLVWWQSKAPRRIVAEVARQLAAIHGLTYTPAVRDAAFRDWGDDPFGGG